MTSVARGDKPLGESHSWFLNHPRQRHLTLRASIQSQKKFICYYVATTGWWWLELWSAMYTLRRQGFFNWIVARAGGYSCGSELLIHLECTNFAIPWTASVAVKTPSMTRFCSKLSFRRFLACGSPCGLQLQGPIKVLQKVDVLPSCPLFSLSTALPRKTRL